jgi:hypothetical protein
MAPSLDGPGRETRMNLEQAFAALGDRNYIRVKTAKGIEYDVERDVLESIRDEEENDYIYGHRVKSKLTNRRRITLGTIKWFRLRSVELV